MPREVVGAPYPRQGFLLHTTTPRWIQRLPDLCPDTGTSQASFSWPNVRFGSYYQSSSHLGGVCRAEGFIPRDATSNLGGRITQEGRRVQIRFVPMALAFH